MAIGCDPSSHPTKQWIEDNIDYYTDTDNPDPAVSGMAFCKTDDDCTIDSITAVSTGSCNSNGRCECSSDSWTGPRCTEPASTTSTDDELYGPPLYISILVALAMVVVTACVIIHQWREAQRNAVKVKEQEQAIEHLRELKPVSSMGFVGEIDASKAEKGTSVLSLSEISVPKNNRREDYSTNFV